MTEHGLPIRFVQENQSSSLKKGTVRGLHAQKPPYSQGKLIRAVRGAIYDVAVDVRPASRTLGHCVNIILNEDDPSFFYIPSGFLHGFSTLIDNTIVSYKTTEFYAPGHEMGVIWNDKTLGIDWPVSSQDAIVSAKDKMLPNFEEMPRVAW